MVPHDWYRTIGTARLVPHDWQLQGNCGATRGIAEGTGPRAGTHAECRCTACTPPRYKYTRPVQVYCMYSPSIQDVPSAGVRVCPAVCPAVCFLFRNMQWCFPFRNMQGCNDAMPGLAGRSLLPRREHVHVLRVFLYFLSLSFLYFPPESCARSGTRMCS